MIFREHAIPERQNVRRRQGSRFRENARLQGDEAQRSVLSLSLACCRQFLACTRSDVCQGAIKRTTVLP